MDPQAHDAVPLSRSLPGTWRLLTRVDTNAQGEEREEPTLGRAPIGLLFYDRGGNFAAQFMRRQRPPRLAQAAAVAANNSRPIDGYDAYFGTYVVNDGAGTVIQVLLGALSREHVGKVLVRRMHVDGDRLVIRVDTTAADGESVTRTLSWQRVGICGNPGAATP